MTSLRAWLVCSEMQAALAAGSLSIGRSFRLLDRTPPDRHRLLNPRLYLVEIIRNRYDLYVLITPTDHVAHTPAALVFQLHIG